MLGDGPMERLGEQQMVEMGGRRGIDVLWWSVAHNLLQNTAVDTIHFRAVIDPAGRQMLKKPVLADSIVVRR